MNKHYLRLCLVQIFWSGTFVASEIAIDHQPPFFTALARFVLTSMVYLFMLSLTRVPFSRRLEVLEKISVKGWAALFLMGLFGVALYTVLLHLGLSKSTAAYAALIIPTTQPVFTAVLGALIASEPISPKILLGLIFGLLGAGLVIFGASGWSIASDDLQGNLLILGSSLSFSVFSVSSRFAPSHLTTTEATTFSFLLGTLMLIPWPFLLDEPISIEVFSGAFLFSLLYLVVFATTLPYLWWNAAVKALGAARTGIFTFLMPPLAVLASVLILNHKPTLISLIGGCLAMLGVFVATRRD